ncbi:MAG: flagellar hook assembly protein FlgD [Bdellovibrionales bacterium]
MSVMNVTKTTRAFANAESTPVGETNPKTSNLSAEELKKLGADNVGELLNKIADPNWTDPSKKIRSAGSDKLDKDAFFKLMLAQIKSQDPTNPLKSHEMAAQLASFSGLEQMQNMNNTLNEMKNGQKPMEQFQALNFIGKSVAGDSSKIVRTRGDKDHDFKFDLKQPATRLEIRVRNNETGETVRKVTLQNAKEGANKFTWNGLNDKGQPAAAGSYQFFAEAYNGNNQKMDIKTDFEGTITGVNYTSEGPILLVGNQSVRMADIKKIQDPSLMKNDQKVNSMVETDLKKQAEPSQTDNKPGETSADSSKEIPGAPDEPLKMQKNLMETVGMSREMMEKITKETSL